MKSKVEAPQAPLTLRWARDAGLAPELIDRVQTKVRTQKRHRKRRIAATGLAAAAALAILWAVPLVRQTGTSETPAGRRQVVSLADGTAIELNARTVLKRDFRFGRREVALEQGEAYFAVPGSATQPFQVKTPAGVVRVLGTEFNVRVTDAGSTTVTLVNGAVVVDGGGESQRLSPGEQLVLDGGSRRPRHLEGEELAATTAWRRGWLVLDGLTLEQAAQKLADYHGATIRVEREVSQLPTGGAYPIDNLRGFLDAVEAVLPVRAVPRSGDFYTIVPRR